MGWVGLDLTMEPAGQAVPGGEIATGMDLPAKLGEEPVPLRAVSQLRCCDQVRLVVLTSARNGNDVIHSG